MGGVLSEGEQAIRIVEIISLLWSITLYVTGAVMVSMVCHNFGRINELQDQVDRIKRSCTLPIEQSPTRATLYQHQT